MIRVAVQYALPRKGLPSAATLRRAATAALKGRKRADLCLRIVGRAEGRRLNRDYRGRDYATNVLSFPARPFGRDGASTPSPLLGDIVICAPVVAAEARAQRKAPAAHWAHMVVHGALHLIGHDHHQVRDARRMEGLERRILAALGHPDPYEPA